MKSSKTYFFPKVIMATICMGSSFPTGKYLIAHEQMPPFLMGGWRFLSAGLLMLVITIISKGYREIIPTYNNSIVKGFILTCIVGCLQTTGTMGFLNIALQSVSSSMSSIILFTNPLWLALAAHFMLKDKLTKTKLVSLVIGILGVIVCLGLDTIQGGTGLIYAFFGSVCWAVCTVISKKFIFDKSSWVFTGWQLLLGAIFMLCIAYLRHEEYNIASLNVWGWIWFIWLIIPASVGSFGLWFSALRQGGATLASGFLFLVPLFSVIFSVLTLHDGLPLHLIIGGGFIVFSLYLLNKGNGYEIR
ncbi:EamA family transporter [Salmonella enterica subsp. enterica]